MAQCPTQAIIVHDSCLNLSEFMFMVGQLDTVKTTVNVFQTVMGESLTPDYAMPPRSPAGPVWSAETVYSRGDLIDDMPSSRDILYTCLGTRAEVIGTEDLSAGYDFSVNQERFTVSANGTYPVEIILDADCINQTAISNLINSKFSSGTPAEALGDADMTAGYNFSALQERFSVTVDGAATVELILDAACANAAAVAALINSKLAANRPAEVTGTVNLSAGHDFSALHESLVISANGGPATTVRLSAACANAAAVSTHINTRMSMSLPAQAMGDANLSAGYDFAANTRSLTIAVNGAAPVTLALDAACANQTAVSNLINTKLADATRTKAEATGNVDRSTGYNFGPGQERFMLAVNGAAPVEILLSSNCSDLAAICSFINVKLAMASLDGLVEAAASGNFVKLQSLATGTGQTFTLATGTPDDALAVLGLAAGTYTGSALSLSVASGVSGNGIELHTMTTGLTQTFTLAAGAPDALTVLGLTAAVYTGSNPVTGVVTEAVGNNVRFKSSVGGSGQTFTVATGTPDALAVLGVAAGTYVGNTLSTQVEAAVSGNFIKIRTLPAIVSQTFTLATGTPDALAVLGIDAGVYTGNTLNVAMIALISTNFIGLRTTGSGATERFTVTEGTPGALAVLGIPAGTYSASDSGTSGTFRPIWPGTPGVVYPDGDLAWSGTAAARCIDASLCASVGTYIANLFDTGYVYKLAHDLSGGQPYYPPETKGDVANLQDCGAFWGDMGEIYSCLSPLDGNQRTFDYGKYGAVFGLGGGAGQVAGTCIDKQCWYNLCSALNCATDSSPCSPSCTCPICGSPTGGCSACNAPLCIRLGYKFSVGTTASGEFEAILTGSGGCVSTYSWSGSFEFEPAAPGYVLTGITIQFVKGNMFAWFYMTVIGTPGSNIVPATLAAANDTPSDVCSEWYVTSMILPDVKIYKLPMGPGEMGQIWVRALQFGDCPI